jgi:hypothetical protein
VDASKLCKKEYFLPTSCLSFGFVMGFVAFVGSAIPSLDFTVIFSFSRDPAWITAVSLPLKAGPIDVENQPAPSAVNLDQ